MRSKNNRISGINTDNGATEESEISKKKPSPEGVDVHGEIIDGAE